MDSPRFTFAVNLGVGYLAYFAQALTLHGISLPLGAVLGFPIGSGLIASFTLDTPLFVTFGPFAGVTFPVLVGGGLEYFLDKSLLLTFNTRMGAAIAPSGPFLLGSRAEFAFDAQLGLAVKL
jgi:hypothetical protein